MASYYISAKDFDPDRLVVKPVKKEKTPKREYEKSDIFYNYPSKGNSGEDVTRELLVLVEDIPFEGGIFFSKNPEMYGRASLSTPIDTNNENHIDIFGDQLLEVGERDGFMKILRRSFVEKLKSVAPGKIPKSAGKFKDVEDIINDKQSIRQDITMPLSEEERAIDTTKKGVSVPTKYFNLKYFASNKILDADDNTLSEEQLRTKKVIQKQKVAGIDTRDVPVGTWSPTGTNIAYLDDNGNPQTRKLPSYTVMKGKNMTVNMILKYSYATFTPKISISESIEEMTITDMSSSERTSLMSSSEFISKLTLTAEQSKRNIKSIEEEKEEEKEEVSENDPYSSIPAL